MTKQKVKGGTVYATTKPAHIHPVYAGAGSTSPAQQRSYLAAHKKGELINQKGKATN